MKKRIKNINEWIESQETKRTKQDVIDDMDLLWCIHKNAQFNPDEWIYVLSKQDYILFGGEFKKGFERTYTHNDISVRTFLFLEGWYTPNLTKRDESLEYFINKEKTKKSSFSKTIIIPGSSNNSLF